MNEIPVLDAECLDDVVICIHHLLRDKHPDYIIKRKNQGDCRICNIDPVNNKYCAGYYPITIHRLQDKIPFRGLFRAAYPLQ